MHQKCLFSVCTAQSIAKQSFGIFVMVKQDYSIAISETIHVIVVSLLRGPNMTEYTKAKLSLRFWEKKVRKKGKGSKYDGIY